MKKLSIYIHIPFCIKKCLYCDFLSAPATVGQQEDYMRALLREIEQESVNYADYEVDTVFIGGGTPSMVESKWIIQMLQTLRACFAFTQHPEITLEMNPGTSTHGKLADYQKAGINRLSIGLQSANEEELKRLGRIHTWEDFLRTWQDATRAGFQNRNVDLMSALPGQSVESYEKTLETVLALEPEHISAYSLIVEEGTPFYSLYGEERASTLSTEAGADTPSTEAGAGKLPTEEEDRIMYAKTKQILGDFGYQRYEISNYAKPGYECRHNLVYWNRGEYVGFGIGAASLIQECRWSNTRNIETYVNLLRTEQQHTKLKQELEKLSIASQIEETMFLGLRLTKGVDREQFKRRFGRSIEEVYPGLLDKFVKQKLIEVDDRVRLTDRGMDVADYVMTDFML